LKSISSFQEIKTTPVLISFSARVEINRFQILKSSFEMWSFCRFSIFLPSRSRNSWSWSHSRSGLNAKSQNL